MAKTRTEMVKDMEAIFKNYDYTVRCLKRCLKDEDFDIPDSLYEKMKTGHIEFVDILILLTMLNLDIVIYADGGVNIVSNGHIKVSVVGDEDELEEVDNSEL